MAKGFNLKAIFSADTKDIERGSTVATESVKKFERDSKAAFDGFDKGASVAGRKAQILGKNIRQLALRFAGAAVSFRTFISSFNKMKDFETSNSKLAAVLGTTQKGIEKLTESAIALGRKTEYTASQVTELQTELAKLGFSQGDIIAMQSGVLKFAAAVGTDLGSAAARAGATMRGFSLTAEETGDMLATMALSTSKSALSFEYLDETLGKVVPVTRSFGLDTRATVALLGAMANAGIDASSAGTALRRIMAELSNSGSKLNSMLGKQPKTMEDVIAGLKSLRDRGIGVTEAFDLVGKYAGATFLALVNGASDCETLYRELSNVDGALNDMYRTMTNNVEGSIKKLSSAWEGFILRLRKSTGPINRMIKGLTKIVELVDRLNPETRISGEKDYYDMVIRQKIENEGANSFNIGTFYAKEKEKLQRLIDDAWNNGRGNRAKKYEEELEGLERAYSDFFENQIDFTETAIPTNTNTIKPGDDDETKSKASKKLQEEAREYAAAQKEIADADAEMEAIAARMLEKYEEEHPAIDKTTSSLVGLASQAAYLVGINEEFNGCLGAITESLGDVNSESVKLAISLENEVTAAVDEIQEKWAEDFDKMQRRAQEFSEGIRSMLGSAFTSTFADLGTFIGDSLTGGENAMQDFSAAMLSTFGDMCIKLGELIITASGALEAIQAALEFSENPWVAAAAGAALIAVGAAVKAGAANIARGGGYSSSSVSSSYGTSGRTSDYASREFTVNVTGTLVANGSQLVAVLNNENKRKQLTT